MNQPTRGADRNLSLADQADPTTDEMLLPQFDDGITLLDVEGGRGVPILQSLVPDHLLLHDGPPFWVDANGHATTLAQTRPVNGCPTELRAAHHPQRRRYPTDSSVDGACRTVLLEVGFLDEIA